MLAIHNLGKHYDGHHVFQGLTHKFAPGCTALCEEDSTGKSTLLGIIAGAINPDTGDVHIDGHSITKAPLQAMSRTAYVPDNCFAFPSWTGMTLLEHIAGEKHAALDDPVFELAHRLGLEPHLHKRFEQMSTGTRRKVYLSAATIGDPAVVIADGPTNGLDAQARIALAEQFHVWSRDRVVLFASHDEEFVQACGARCTDVAALRPA